MKDLAIYTAIFGGRDEYHEPPKGDYDCFVFSDMKIETKHAKAIRVPEIIKNSWRRTARIFKLLPYIFLPEHKYVAWIDGSMSVRPKMDKDALLSFLAGSDMATFKHRHRSCIYEEAETCISSGLDHASVIRNQMRSYMAEGYPKDNGLFETGILLRRMSGPVTDLCMEWWEELSFYSKRDQLSLPYVAWKRKFNISLIDGRVDDNAFFSYIDHIR